MSKENAMKTALITGASRGLGFALADALAGLGWKLIITARNPDDLLEAERRLQARTEVRAISGDVAHPRHRQELLAGVERLDLLVNNASQLGLGPDSRLADYPASNLRRLFETNFFAPLALTQLALPALRKAAGRVINISSDAALGAYAGWGVYGASKAALDQFSNVLGAEEPALRVYAVDPGEMQTSMLREAFPKDDLSDRADPADVAQALLELVHGDLPSGRYQAGKLQGVRS
jgi:NAD(P)-dependent dehydrogenase (short-subunit alcohol dehydrogenase family)